MRQPPEQNRARVLSAGKPWPLGASLVTGGVNFAVFSPSSSRLTLCLFDAGGTQELERLVMPARTAGVWHGFLPDASLGQVYGFRTHESAKLLLDPYARALVGEYRMSESHGLGAYAHTDNAADTVKAVVVDEHDFDWQGDAPPATPLSKTVLYEVHVKGFSELHPGVPAEWRGTYDGLASPAAIAHFRKLGVTALSVLPVHEAIDEVPLLRRGLVNYWGYNTLAFFAPARRYARGDARHAFRRMVAGLHAAGIEVILDVVYNHTAEGDHTGPTLSWRGLANDVYYRLRRDDNRYHENHSGCGNTLNVAHPRVLQMVMDSLRYWASVMHVDGFRFDLASILGRDDDGFNRRSAFFQAIAQDPVLSRVKLIAEPWDIGPGGYQLGAYPAPWSEWNDRYRRAVRAFWLTRTADREEFVESLAGSPRYFPPERRGRFASINYVCAHDGFTLRDLLSYNSKRNAANGEANRDGSNDNLSWNCGEEGPSSLLAVNALRNRLARAMLASLLLSRGVPMLLGGDELGRTQSGNNNAYAQDNPLSWFDWATADAALTAFVGSLVALRQRYAQFVADDDGFSGESVRNPVSPGDPDRLVVATMLDGSPPLLLLINADARDWAVSPGAGHWRCVLDTAATAPFAVRDATASGQTQVHVMQRSVQLLEQANP